MKTVIQTVKEMKTQKPIQQIIVIQMKSQIKIRPQLTEE